MSGDFVLDCSVTMTWFFAHEATRATLLPNGSFFSGRDEAPGAPRA